VEGKGRGTQSVTSSSGDELASTMISVDGKSYDSQFVLSALAEYVSEERLARIEKVLENRTRSVIPVVEGIHNSGNIAAVMRSAEGMGFFEFHVIENKEYFKQSSRTTQGSDKWLDIKRWDDTGSCLRDLKNRGYSILVTDLDAKHSIEDLDFSQKTAIVFGNEARGISKEAIDLADERCIIPMRGFVESYNISVASALCLQQAMHDRTRRLGKNGDLAQDDLLEIKANYFIQSVRAADKILERKYSDSKT